MICCVTCTLLPAARVRAFRACQCIGNAVVACNAGASAVQLAQQDQTIKSLVKEVEESRRHR